MTKPGRCSAPRHDGKRYVSFFSILNTPLAMAIQRLSTVTSVVMKIRLRVARTTCGLVQGGVLMTFADRSCGMTARYVSGKPTLATVQLDTHFVEAGKIGETLVSKPHVVRTTRSLIFITTEVTVDKRCIAMASGVFKILKNET